MMVMIIITIITTPQILKRQDPKNSITVVLVDKKGMSLSSMSLRCSNSLTEGSFLLLSDSDCNSAKAGCNFCNDLTFSFITYDCSADVFQKIAKPSNIEALLQK